jgi:putative methionine-R-sulfoxide reductase with GAF domain
VPERILNKPGKLTAAEYEQMKRHVDVGTEILSAVDFPYPIVPIVAAHHERWDGSGYPRGLHGTHIPIGARILSVVDCYDAVTSDRPYRTALSESQALEILVERRGTMYDPVVVDAFVRMLHEAPAADSTPAKPAATRIYDVSSDPSPPAATPGAPDDVQAIMALSRLAADEETGGDILNLAARLVRRLVPGSTCGFYRLSGNSLVLQHAVGPIAVHLQGLTIAMNERVTGWVAAYRQPVINADPGLDLSELHFPSGFGSCASVPLIDQGRVVGVVTVYANGPGAFSDDRAQQFQMMAPYLAQIFDRANQSASMPAHRGETSGPTAHAFQSNSRRMPTSAGSAMGSGRHLTAQYAPRRG